jgi:alpha-beta hydrolase superfamily lysophospholipase
MPGNVEPEKISFVTDDGVNIKGLFLRPAGDAVGVAVLLHMMPATKESWLPLMSRLAALGVASLAIDLRGHGESVEGPDGRLDYKLFEEKDHRAKIHDVEAAARWLAEAGVSGGERPVVVGASIGANLAIAFAADHPKVPGAAALSPGLDYRGVTTPDKVGRFRPQQGLFLAASEEDELSFRTDRELAMLKPDSALKEYRGAGHGTGLWIRRPELLDELASWIAERLT